MQEKKNDKSKIVARVLVICAAALIVLAAAAGVILSRRYVRLGQQFIPVNAAVLDLRGSHRSCPARQVHRAHGAGCA